MALPKVEVGDRLILRHVGNYRGRADSAAVVTSVGRKWGTADTGDYGRQMRFDLSTGYEDGKGYMSTRRLMTPEMADEEDRRREAVKAMGRAGLTLEHGKARLATETLEAIVALLPQD